MSSADPPSGVRSPDGPPVPAAETFVHREHGVPRPDPYHWMGDAADPRLLPHLRAERAWFDRSSAHRDSLVARLRAEMASRVPPA